MKKIPPFFSLTKTQQNSGTPESQFRILKSLVLAKRSFGNFPSILSEIPFPKLSSFFFIPIFFNLSCFIFVCALSAGETNSGQYSAKSACQTAAAAEELSLMPRDNELESYWKHKINVSLSWNPEKNFLTADVNTDEFNFGWIQRKMPDTDFTKFSGFTGRFRVPKENIGHRIHALMVLPREGQESEYYSQEIGFFSDSHGEWVDFFLPFRAFTPERNARVRSFDAKLIRANDFLEISFGVGKERTQIEFDSLRFTTISEENDLFQKMRRQHFIRSLKPESELTDSSHPRLLLTEKRLKRIREKSTSGGVHQAGYERLLQLAEEAMTKINADEPLTKAFAYSKNDQLTAHKNRGRFEGTLNPLVIPLETLAAAAVITQNERYGKHAAKALVNMARTLNVDSPEIDQGFYYTRTFYVRALAFGYDWLYRWLTPEERRDVKITLLGFIENIYEHSWKDSWGSHPLDRVWNWDPGLVSCAGIGILAIQGETRIAEDAMLFQFRRHLRDYLTLGIDLDGCGHEGPAYLSYGIGAGIQFAECLREQGLGDLFTETNWHLIAPWLTAELLPNRPVWNNLSDCSHGRVTGCPVYAYSCGRLAELAKSDPAIPGERLPAPQSVLSGLDYLQHFQEKPGPKLLSYGAMAELMGWCWNAGATPQYPQTFRDASALAFVLFYEECPIAENPGKYLPNLLFFRGRGLVVAREGGYGKNGLHLAIEAGPHAAGHDQSDKGTFTLRAFGSDLVIDSGYGNDGEQKKSGSSYAHNVLLIDGKGQPMNWHNSSDGEITGCSHSEKFDWIRASALGAWNYRHVKWKKTDSGEEVEKADRHYLMMRDAGDGNPPYLVTFDDYRKKDGKAHDFTWQWHTSPEFQLKIKNEYWQAIQHSGEFRVLTTQIGRCFGSAVFELTAPDSGKYQILGLSRCAGTFLDKSDSFFVEINDEKKFCWDLIPAASFSWSPLKERDTESVLELNLQKGEKIRCTISAREPEAQLALLKLIPAGSELPPLPVPEEINQSDASLQTAEKAKMNPQKPFLLENAFSKHTETTLTVFPVLTTHGETAQHWFETSNAGNHPRLTHTVNAVEPEFLMVLVPRAEKKTPLPMVEPLRQNSSSEKDEEAFPGTKVIWPNGRVDHILFKPGKNGLVPEVHQTFPK
ncbi:MAG: heparinase II/III family protein [Thermoguttaceae bacterium]|nr:heparinase II/III family protein [Thermoguttaceae bacterium]